MEPKTEEAVVGIVVTKGKVLIGRVTAVKEQKMKGIRYVFPGGKLKPGETAQAAAEREVNEETGHIVVAGEIIAERIHPTTGALMHYLLCSLSKEKQREGAVPNPEIQEVLFVPIADLANYMPTLFTDVKNYLDSINQK